MKKSVIVLFILTFSLLGASYDCMKARTNIEKMICSDKELSLLDENLSQAFEEAKQQSISKKKLKEEQLRWLKKRNDCETIECINTAYKKRIQDLNILIVNQKDFVRQMLEAQKEAEAIYKKTKNVYRPIKILNNVGIKNIFKKRPDDLSKEQYANLVKGYSFYYIYTDEDIMHGKNLHLAIDLLEKIKQLTPKDTEVYLLQGRAYLKLFRFSLSTTLISSYSTNKEAYDESYTIIPPKMKAAYVQYAKLAKEQNIPLQLNQEEISIVNRQRMFFDYFNSFVKKDAWWHPIPESMGRPKYKEKYKNICNEYVEMLNYMPDNNLTECSRYVNVNSSEFEYATYKNTPEDLKINFKESWDKSATVNVLKYKNDYFTGGFVRLRLSIVDEKYLQEIYPKYSPASLTIVDSKYPIYTCKYMFVDFKKEWQKKHSKCNQIKNYKTKYPNKRNK